MDDFKIIFWIIIGLIYLFARKKKKDQPPPVQRKREEADLNDQPTAGKPVTFEELLREIEQMKTPQPPPPIYRQPEPQREPEYVDYDDNLEDEKKGLEETYDDTRATQVYEDAKKLAFHRPSLEETMKVEDTIVRFNQFNEYKTEKHVSPAAEFRTELRNPSSFRKAFIMSEIIKRKF